jgi:PAS domain S-box-containing protein
VAHGLDGLVLAASLGEILGALFVSAIAAGCNHTYPRFHLESWAWSWLAAALMGALGMLSALLAPSPSRVAAASSAAFVLLCCAQLAWFLAGAHSFLKGAPPKPWHGRARVLAALALGLAVVAAGSGPGAVRAMAGVLPGALLGGSFLWAGWSALRGPVHEGVGVRLVGGTLLLLGAGQLHDAALRVSLLAGGPFPAYALLIGFIDYAVLTGLGLGLVQTLLDDESRRLAQSEAERRAHEAELERERDRLRASEEKFAKVFRSSPDAILISDPWEGKELVDVNEGFERLSGYTAAEAIGKSTLELGLWVRPEDQQRVVSHLERYGRHREAQVEMRTRSGERRVCSMSAEVIETAGRRYVVTVARDVTAQREAEQRLRDSEERLRRISEATFEGIVLSEDGIMVDANAQLAAMLGCRPEELIGRPVLDCVAPEDRARVTEALGSGHASAYEHRALRKDGSVFQVEIRARTLTVQGRLLRVTAIRDLSERTRLEAELRRRDTLAAMGTLVAAVAHEVRTPLFSLSATIDALDAGSATPSQDRELRELLVSQVRRLSNLMGDLLDYGRPPTLKPVVAGIRDPLERAVRACSEEASQGGVQVELAIPAELPPISADPQRLEQVFENLVSNAVQHAPRGSKVRVSVAAEGGERVGLSCRIEDEGSGIPAADLERLFEPFFTKRRGGTGLGLPIAQRFAEAHGGSLTATNRPEGGAMFIVWLPLPPATDAGGALA